MNEKVEAEIIYTPEDYARVSKIVTNRQFLNRHLFLAPFILVAAVLVFVFIMDPKSFVLMVLQRDTFLPLVISLAIATFLLSSFLLYWKNTPSFLLKRNFRNQFRSSPVFREPKSTILDDEGISSASNLGNSTTKWDAYIEVDETDEFFLFFTSKNFAQFLPKRAFTDQQHKQIRTLIKRKMGDRAKLLL